MGATDFSDTDSTAAGLMDYPAASPSPFHACVSAARLLRAAGFIGMAESSPFPTDPGRYYVIRGGSLVAFSTEHLAGRPADPANGFRVVGAHTNSRNLRIEPQPGVTSAGWQQLGVEVYGGPLLNSWLDRDLGLSGRSSVRASALPERLASSDPAGVATALVHVDEPLLRVAQLAIHMDRGVNTDGVKINPQ